MPSVTCCLKEGGIRGRGYEGKRQRPTTKTKYKNTGSLIGSGMTEGERRGLEAPGSLEPEALGRGLLAGGFLALGFYVQGQA